MDRDLYDIIDGKLDLINNKLDKIDSRLYNIVERVSRAETTIGGIIKVGALVFSPLAVGIILSLLKLYSGGKL
jgi:hypothetical protein